MRLLMRKVTLLRQKGKRSYFRISEGGIAYSASRKLFEPDSLASLVESAGVAALRKKYAGKHVWTYGPQDLWCEQPGGKLEADVDTSPLSSIKIERIYQLARKRARFREGGSGFGDFEVYGDLDPTYYGSDEMYVFIFTAPKLRITGGGGNFTDRDWVRSRFGPLYTLILGTWSLPQRYSLKPPPAWAQRAFIKLSTSTDYGRDLIGLSHREVAWAYGWPGTKQSFSVILTKRVWDFDHGYNLTFANDRVVEGWRHLPH